MLPIQDMKKRLRDQLKFLKRSAEAFDAGCTEEAVRIATVLRVIFHQTSQSTSLLTHLNAANIRIRSKRVPENSTGAMLQYGWSLARMRMSVSPAMAVLVPIVEPEDSDTMVKWDVWWKASFAALDGINYSRCGVALCAANKDGGTHVDKRLPAAYAKIRAAGAFGTLHDSQGDRDIEEAHYVFLRTMACEVLHSPELLELAG
jgi:hypothetical protein